MPRDAKPVNRKQPKFMEVHETFNFVEDKFGNTGKLVHKLFSLYLPPTR